MSSVLFYRKAPFNYVSFFYVFFFVQNFIETSQISQMPIASCRKALNLVCNIFPDAIIRAKVGEANDVVLSVTVT